MSLRSRVGLISAVLVVTAALALGGRRGAFTHNGTPTGDDSIAVTDTVMIDGETPTCSACTLEATRVALLGTPRDPEIPQRVPSVLRDSRGTHYLVFNGWSDKPILRYDSTGRYLGKIGSYGKGPGEYTMTHTVFVGAGDSLFVYAWGRQFQMYAPDGSYQRLVRVPRGTPVGLIPGTEGLLYAATQPMPNALDADRPVLVIDGQGEVVDSFPVFSVDFFNTARPVVGPDGSLWTYMERNYRLERHARDGSVEQLIGVVAPPERARPIMTSIEADSLLSIAQVRASARGRGTIPIVALPFGPPKGPRPHMTMMVDSTGLLWVVRNIAAPRWDTLTITPQHLSPNEAPGETTIPREQEDRMYQAIVEVIDPRRAQLLARTTLPFLGILAAPGYVARVTTDDDGHYRTEVYHVALQRSQAAARD